MLSIGAELFRSFLRGTAKRISSAGRLAAGLPDGSFKARTTGRNYEITTPQCLGPIFMVLSIIYIIKRPKIKNLSAMQFPQTPVTEFLKWRRYELLSIDIFLAAVWGGGLIGIVMFAAGTIILYPTRDVPGKASPFIESLMMLSFAIPIVTLFVGLVISAIYGSTAVRLRKRLGIPPVRW